MIIMDKYEKALRINKNDNVGVALADLMPHDRVEIENSCITIGGNIARGHKLALKSINQGEDIIKYGYPIGHATRFIRAGEHVHVHNLKTNLKGVVKYSYSPAFICQEQGIETVEKPGFKGYARGNGEIGIRNEIWIIPTVGCVNKTAEIIQDKAREIFRNEMLQGKCEGIFAFVHPYGCSQLGSDLLDTQRILAGLVKHPNAAGVLVLGLGCENNNIREFKRVLGEYNERRVRFLAAQDAGNEIEEALNIIAEMVEYVGLFKRQELPASRLVIGLKCGGSDAFSGITANPLLGLFSDMLVKQGGTALLTEVPEMFGAETILMNRCIDEEVFEKTVQLINNFKKYYIEHGQEIFENPSPGNKEGGITTLEEKSLGCILKGGMSKVADVLGYGKRVSKPGLNLLQAPGNDIVSSTALTAAGAHLILFTTGRGTPLGAPVPTVKISSNSKLFNSKKHWIDFDAGQILKEKDIHAVKNLFFEFVLNIASGETRSRNEANGCREIAVFKKGVTL
jgi:altronate hydrolase